MLHDVKWTCPEDEIAILPAMTMLGYLAPASAHKHNYTHVYACADSTTITLILYLAAGA